MNDDICSGSHLNKRSFKEDDYWASFQSTIVSGQVMSVDETIGDAGELSTLIEDGTIVEKTLDMNLDVIPEADPDNDTYFDCPAFVKSPANLSRRTQAAATSSVVNVTPHPRYVAPAQLCPYNSPPHNSSNTSGNNINCRASPRKQRPESARRISPSSSSMATTSASSGLSSGAATRTASTTMQMIDDEFNDLFDRAHSSPKVLSDSGNPTSSNSINDDRSSSPNSIDQIRKTLDFENAETVAVSSEPSANQKVDVSARNKENFFDGKYSKFVSLRHQEAMEKKSSAGKSPLKASTRTGKVALLAQYFQNQVVDESIRGKSMSKSRIPLPIRKSSRMSSHVKTSPQVKSRDSGSPRYQTRKSYKLLSSRRSSTNDRRSSSAKTFNSSGNESFLTRNQPKLSRATRLQSRSGAANPEMTPVGETSKNHSTLNLATSADSSASSIKALHSSKITMRKYLKKNNGTPSSQRKLPTAKKSSAIQNRKSVGMQVKNSSPVKPVTELRKIFSPSKRTRVNVKKDSLAVPKIVISRH